MEDEETWLIQTSWERRLAEMDRQLRYDLLHGGPVFQALKMKIERYVIIAALVNFIWTLAAHVAGLLRQW